MPIEIRNLNDFKEYKIDYLKWKKEFSNLKILRNHDLQEEYLDNWMKALLKADKASVEFFSKPQNLLLMAKERIEAPEIFQKAIIYGFNTVYVHFRVSRIIQAIEESGCAEENAKDVDLNIFTETKRVDWTETECHSGVKDNPIIMVPFIIGANVQFVVIDGNHRITYAVKKGKNKIRCHNLDPQSLVDNKFFCTDFDKLLYIFHNEVIWLGSNCAMINNTQDDEWFLANTYFKSGKVNIWGQS